jgi:ribosome-binding factor A
MNQKDDKLKEIIRALAADFFSRESNRQSLITVTNIDLRNRASKAIILMTVLPEDKQQAALEFAQRQLSEFREYVKKNSRIQRIPFFEARLDVGEKNRQRMDEIEKSI